jgi:hypothetical protein
MSCGVKKIRKGGNGEQKGRKGNVKGKNENKKLK